MYCTVGQETEPEYRCFSKKVTHALRSPSLNSYGMHHPSAPNFRRSCEKDQRKTERINTRRTQIRNYVGGKVTSYCCRNTHCGRCSNSCGRDFRSILQEIRWPPDVTLDRSHLTGTTVIYCSCGYCGLAANPYRLIARLERLDKACRCAPVVSPASSCTPHEEHGKRVWAVVLRVAAVIPL